MTAKQQPKQQEPDELAQKLASLGHTTYKVLPGIDDLPMLHIKERLICGVELAAMLSDDELKDLIDETLQVAGGES